MNVIAASARISPLADIEESSRGSRLVIGERCSIDAFVKIKFSGGSGDIVIGDESYVNSGTVIYSGHGIHIGNHVMIAANCTLAPSNHEYARRDVPMVGQHTSPSKGGILIEDDVWIGAGCVLLDGAVIRRGAIVGAMALVRGEVEAYAIYGGVPATLLRYRPE